MDYLLKLINQHKMKKNQTKKCPVSGREFAVEKCPPPTYHSLECKRKSIINQLKTKQNDTRKF
jgi:hypothetical protein